MVTAGSVMHGAQAAITRKKTAAHLGHDVNSGAWFGGVGNRKEPEAWDGHRLKPGGTGALSDFLQP